MGMNLLTAREVQDLLDVDRSTVYRMADDGRLPAVKIGRQWRFPASEIERLVHPTRPTEVPATMPLEEWTGEGPAPSVDQENAQTIVDLAASALGVMMVVTDLHGLPLTEVANPNPWFAEHASQPEVFTRCTAEWRRMADDPDFSPRFQEGAFGFECARTFVRSGRHLVAMLLAGGVAPEQGPDLGFHRLEPGERREVLERLPSVGALLSRCAVITNERWPVNGHPDKRSDR